MTKSRDCGSQFFMGDLWFTVYIERFGTKDVIYSKVDDTHFSVTAQVEISNQFFGWILGFGNRVKLLAPDDVADQFRAYLDKIRGMY